MTLTDSYDAFLIDLDGVVWLGHEFIPGAVDKIAELKRLGKGYAFVTNSPRQSPAEHAASLRAGGVDLDDSQVVTSASALISHVRRQIGTGAKVYAIGTPSFRAQLEAAGFALLDAEQNLEADAVLVSGHDRFDYAELKAASMAARAGAPLIATSSDPTLPMPDGFHPGVGAILAAIETASGREAVITGKPSPEIFRTAIEAIGDPGRVAMIGDRIGSDIEGAHNAGLDGILVTSGSTSAEELAASAIKPEHLIEALGDLT